jgi:hypothetical protein
MVPGGGIFLPDGGCLASFTSSELVAQDQEPLFILREPANGRRRRFDKEKAREANKNSQHALDHVYEAPAPIAPCPVQMTDSVRQESMPGVQRNLPQVMLPSRR